MKSKICIGTVGYMFDGAGLLLSNGKPVSRAEAIAIIGCSEKDFDELMFGNAKGIESDGKVVFENATLASIQLFCLQQIVAAKAA